MPTIRDVAKESGVSTATVSNVLNETERPVHPRTRQRVLEAASRLNYHPNALARSLVGGRLHSIGVHFGVIEPEVITNPYAVAILQGIMTTAAHREYNVTLSTVRWRGARESAARFRDGRADGYIVVAPTLDSDIVQGLSDVGLPVVVVSSKQVPPGVPFVDVENYAGLRLAVEHVISLGHTRIAHISGNPDQPSVAARRAGFLDAMKEAGLPVPPEYLVTSWYIIKRSIVDAKALLTLPNRPTAIVAGSDNTAIGVLEAAREMGISVPNELSVTGFDDISPAASTHPPLTTVRQPLVEIGSIAARLLLEKIEKANGNDAQAHRVEPTLIVRSSTAAAPAAATSPLLSNC